MRLAYLSTDPGIPFGGTKGGSVHIAEIVGALAGGGNEVLLLVSESASEATVPEGVIVEPLPGPGKAASATERIDSQDELAKWLIERLRRFRADAVYERLALYSAAGSVAARSLRIPYLVELNAPLLEEAARYRTLDEREGAARLEGLTLSSADIVLAVSSPLADYASAKGASRVEVLQNAAATERYSIRRRTRGRPVAVFSGSLRPWHGIETIAGAWRLLGRAAPPLLVVGDGPSRRLLDGLPATLLGAVPPQSVPALLRAADIGLAPYGPGTPRYFSPLKLFEYLAAGLATVVADLPAACEVVGPDTAVIIPAGDAEALADAVVALCADPARRESLGQNGRALVAAGHTWRHRARRIIELVGELTPVEASA